VPPGAGVARGNHGPSSRITLFVKAQRLYDRSLSLAVLAAGVLAGCSGARPARFQSASPTADAPAVLREYDRLAGLDLWPGFAPLAVPLALYDGERTWLYRHPAPPPPYSTHHALPELAVRPGRDSLVTANSTVILAGVRTAAAMPSPAPVLQRAATLIHEAFHAFQLSRHPSWGANEVHLFTYPFADASLLALRRIEYAALRAAALSRAPGEVACNARAALSARRQRFAAMSADSRSYERGNELREGLAEYVEQRSVGFPRSALPEDDAPIEGIRQRGYVTGLAMGMILDRVLPAWRDRLERSDSTWLDALLDSALAAVPGEVCTIAPRERAAFERQAAADVAALAAARERARRDFMEQPGWRIVIVAAAPLWPQGFDPLNVRLLDSATVLHSRFMRAGNERGTVEVLGRQAVTRAAGEHPLFNGVREVVIAGLTDEPRVLESQGILGFEAPGVRGEFRGAIVERSAGVITIRL
jgi:hypothetical protein